MEADLAAGVIAGDRRAIADALNLIDDRRPDQRRKADALLRELGGCDRRPRIGLTGAPGAGKSTLLDALSRKLRERGHTLGIIAVDPSSQRTGGALLGDRIRVRGSSRDPGVFFRSMAARDRLGGLAAATHAGVTILEAAFDRVLVETVGVGQSEGEIAQLVDTLVYVAQPGAGDLLQYMKAGLVELPDVFVVNKSDMGAIASQTASELRSGVSLSPRERGDWEPPILLASARDDSGIESVCDALENHEDFLAGERAVARRRAGRDHFVREEVLRRYGTFGLTALGGEERLAEICGEREDPSPYGLLELLGREIESALCG